MNKLLMKIKHTIMLPLVAVIALSASTPAAAYSYDYSALISKIIALLAPLLGNKKGTRLARKKALTVLATKNRTSVKSRVQPQKAADAQAPQPVFNVPVQPVVVRQVEKPQVERPVAVAQPAVAAVAVKAAVHETHHENHDELLGTYLERLHTCIQTTQQCKQAFLDQNTTRSYRAFKQEFDANLAALQLLSNAIAHKHSSGEQFKAFGHIMHELINAQALMCNALNGNYGSGMELGLALAKIEKPTAAARKKVETLVAHLQKSLRGKNHTLKKLKTVATDIHTLLAPPAEQGLGVFALLGICSKRT